MAYSNAKWNLDRKEIFLSLVTLILPEMCSKSMFTSAINSMILTSDMKKHRMLSLKDYKSNCLPRVSDMRWSVEYL